MVILVKLVSARQKVPQYIIKIFIIIVSRKRHPIFNLTNLTLTNLTTPKKNLKKVAQKF